MIFADVVQAENDTCEIRDVFTGLPVRKNKVEPIEIHSL